MDSNQDQELSRLLVAAQEGNTEEYERFLSEVTGILRTYLSKRMKDQDSVEDVLQDTLLSIHRARHTYQPGKLVGPWIYAICKHRMIDFFRKFQRIEKSEVSSFENMEHVALESFAKDSNEKGAQVLAMLEKLPQKQKDVIKLLKMKDLSVREVARQTGMSESAVKVTAFRGYQTIRRWYGVKQK